MDKCALRIAAAFTVGAIAPVHAAQDSDSAADIFAIDRPEFQVGDFTIRLGGLAAGALFIESQARGPTSLRGYDNTGASGIVATNVLVQRFLDNGMVVGAGGAFLLYHDNLSSDRYDNDTVEQIFLFAQTGLGRVGVGQQDGVGYTLGLVGPLPDEQVSLEKNRSLSLFRDPTTGKDFGVFFRQRTNVQASSNYAKINYESPRLFGLQLGGSFTPEVNRSPLPYTGNPEDASGRQQNLWELGANYTGYFSSIALGLSAGFAHASLKNRTSGFSDLYDWALGAQLIYRISEIKLSAGGAYRETNAYLLDVNQVYRDNNTRVVHASAMAERGAWLFGGEYSHADVSGPVDYGIAGYQLTAGYRVNNNLHLSAGWQWYNYRRGTGIFYNGSPAISMNAGFLTLAYEL